MDFVQDEQTLVEDKPTIQWGSFSAKMQLTSDEANWMKVNTWRGDNEDKVARPRPSLISLESKRPPGTFAHRTSFTKSQAGQKGPAGGAEGSFYSHSSFSCHRHQGRFLEPDEIYLCEWFNISWAENSHWLSGIDIAHRSMSFTPVSHAKWKFWNCSVCFYSTPPTEGVESTRRNSVCLSVCPSSNIQ